MSVAATSCTAMTHATAMPMPRNATGPPTAMSSRHGMMPTIVANIATMPMPALAIMFSPHVRLNSAAERFTASIGPTCSITITGSTRKVTSDHARPTSEPMMRPAMPDRSSIARITSDTVAVTTAHGSSTCARRAGRVHRLADRDRLAAQALVGREHQRGVEEHDDERDSDVADDPEDPRERLRPIPARRCRR